MRVCKRENKSVLSKVLVYYCVYCFLVFVISLCGRTYETETAIVGRHLLFSHDHSCSPVTVLHGLLPLHSLESI